MKNKAIFFDRDGTIIDDVGFIKSITQIKFYPETFDALKMLSDEGFLLFIVTNQVGVARKHISIDELTEVNNFICNKLASEAIKIEEVYICVHDHNDNCECRKPSTYFLKKAAKKYNLDLANCYVIGDHPSDLLTARNCGAKEIYLLSGHGLKHIEEAKKITTNIVPGILSAAEWIKINENINRIYSPNELTDIIDRSAQVLKDGGTVVVPTETVYGLGADATNPEAIKKIFSIKQRPFNDPLIVHISSLGFLSDLVEHISRKAMILIENLWPGPLTIIFKKKPIIPDIATAMLPTVAIRMPLHPIALKLINTAGLPIAAPSANLFSELSPTRFSDISKHILKRADIAIDGGDCIRGIESTIISLIDEKNPIILRAGSVSIEKIESLIGKVNIRTDSTESSEAPGLQKKHYSPKTPLFIVQNIEDISMNKRKNSALLAFSNLDQNSRKGFKNVNILSDNCGFRKAASLLYATLAEFDKQKLEAIYVILPENKLLGRAIRDRLIRAASD